MLSGLFTFLKRLEMIFPRRTYHLLDTAYHSFCMRRLNQEEIVTLRGCSEFQAETLCTEKSARFHKLIILFDVELVRPPRLVLIIYHAGAGTIILGQLKREHEFVALGRTVGRWYDQPIIGINKDDVTILQLLHSSVMPFPAERLALRFACICEIKRLRIKGCLQNVRTLQGADFPFT